MQMETLEDLYVDVLKDLYDAEGQILKALPKMAKAASSPELQKGFQEHFTQTQRHVERLNQVFEQVGKTPKKKKCKAMEALLEEGKELMNADSEAEVLDAALIAAAQKVEHYEIAGYGCARTYADLLQQGKASELLEKTLDEEKLTDKKLSELAMSEINIEAADEESDESASPKSHKAPATRSRKK
jgi:ferritin-like metal-binding protein YciE